MISDATRLPADANRDGSSRPALSRRDWLAAVATAVVSSTAVGCARYRIGNESLYSPDVATVHVPMVRSASFRRHLGERLTEAIVKEIELKTPYKVVGSTEADSVLACTLVSDSKRLVVESDTDEGREYEVTFGVQVSWMNRTGDLIAQRQVVPMPGALASVLQEGRFVPETGQSLVVAQEDAIRRLAEQIVSLMEAPW
jgi:hypothetical protein